MPVAPGRTDVSQEQTDVESFAALEPTADGFRSYLGRCNRLPAEYLLVDKANPLSTPRDNGPRRWPARPGREPQAVAH